MLGVKLLRPGVVSRSCRRTLFGIPMDQAAPSFDAALAAALAVDPEANVVDNATVTWTWRNALLYDRQCVELRGDVARMVPTLVLPGGAGHEGHRGH
jgi:hypothetical protein